MIEPLHPERLTWAALLGRWVDFARASLALPQDGDAGLLRESVTDIITLQAVWMALHEMDELADDQRRLGLDRAGVLIDKHGTALRQRWLQSEMPELIDELIGDATKAYADALEL